MRFSTRYDNVFRRSGSRTASGFRRNRPGGRGRLRPMRRRLPRPAAALLLAFVLVLAAGCGGDRDEDAAPATTAATATDDGSGTTETGEETTETGEETPPEPPPEPEGPPFQEQPASGESTGPTPGSSVSLLANVRLAHRDGYDRIVFEFRPGGAPSYRVDYVQPPITTDPGGAPMSLGGEAFLQIRMEPASGFDIEGNAEQIYRGPLRLVGEDAGARMVVDAVRTGDFEAVVTWVAGLTRRTPFRVFTLDGPPRLVIDIRTG